MLVVGGWQLLTSMKVIDPFFFGQPSGIVLKLRDWLQHGTAYGSIWLQVWITMREALLGFLFGVAGGVVFGVLLGQVRFLADVLGPYIKAMNALPRIVLGSIFVVWLGLGSSSKVMLAAVLVFFVVFFNAFQGVREVDPQFHRQRPGPRCLPDAGRPQRRAAVRADLDHRQPARGLRLLDHRRHRR